MLARSKNRKAAAAPRKYPCSRCHQRFPKLGLTKDYMRPWFLRKDEKAHEALTVCRRCRSYLVFSHYADELALKASTNAKHYRRFLKSIYEVELLTHVAVPPIPDRSIRHSLSRLLFVQIVATVESYLGDTFVSRVTQDQSLQRLCVEQMPEFKDRALKLPEIYGRHERLKNEILEVLAEMLWHRIDKVRMMYRSILGVPFPDDIGDIFRAILTRHDIVHRSGETKSGQPVVMTPNAVRKLINSVRQAIRFIDGHLPPKAATPSE